MINALSFDIEDYFQPESLAKIIPRGQWEEFPSRIEDSTGQLLELCAKYKVSATFFILGWIAQRHPRLVKAIANQGHEIACHGQEHRLIYQQSPEEFRADVSQSKHLLEDIIAQPVIGFRAPTFSITKKTLWALDILAEEGFKYDSSVFPIKHDRYGIPDAPRFAHKILPDQGLYEFPPSTLRCSGLNFPVGGGGYLRLLPYAYTRWGIQRLNKKNQPALVYLHPWEVDVNQPRFNLSGVSAWRHYHNIPTTKKRMECLLKTFKFAPLKDVLGLSEGASC